MIIRRLLLALPFLLLGWLGVLIVVMRFSDVAPGAVVILPHADFLSALPPDMAILAHSDIAITLTSDEPQVARRLYQAGAWLVLPAGLPGCFPLPSL